MSERPVYTLSVPKYARTRESLADFSGNSGTIFEILRLMCRISSLRLSLSMSRTMACVINMTERKRQITPPYSPYPSLGRLECRRNHESTRRFPPLICSFFGLFPVVFIDANLLVDSFPVPFFLASSPESSFMIDVSGSRWLISKAETTPSHRIPV